MYTQDSIMSYWNYRVVSREDYYGVHEVHYDDDGQVEFLTEYAVTVTGDDVEELKWVLHHMEANLALPVINYETMKEIENDKDGNSKNHD
jgi:hypothetical protein|tara:strand:- start:554 stop:823 length:270 start_codon:yes stop_codon:yes gene_type:complete